MLLRSVAVCVRQWCGCVARLGLMGAILLLYVAAECCCVSDSGVVVLLDWD